MAEIRGNDENAVDIPARLWYADTVGAVIETASGFVRKATNPLCFVNFHMETFQNSARIGYLLSWFFFRGMV